VRLPPLWRFARGLGYYMAAARIRETPPLLSRSGGGGAIVWERSIANRLGGVISVASRLLLWPEAERKGFRALHAEAVIASHTPALVVGTVDASHDDIDAARRAAGVASSSCGEVTRPRMVLEGQRARASR
jgi:hypothetical protein